MPLETYIQYDVDTGDIKATVNSSKAPDVSGNADIGQIKVAPGTLIERKRVNLASKTLEDAPLDEWDAFLDKWPTDVIVDALGDATKLAQLQSDAQNSRVQEVVAKKATVREIKKTRS
jgi:hypothetical protein